MSDDDRVVGWQPMDAMPATGDVIVYFDTGVCVVMDRAEYEKTIGVPFAGKAPIGVAWYRVPDPPVFLAEGAPRSQVDSWLAQDEYINRVMRVYVKVKNRGAIDGVSAAILTISMMRDTGGR